MIKVEVCVESPAGIDAALEGGADRIELCACLALGGLTPSLGLQRRAVASGLETRVLIRPRAGGFVYDRGELAVMADDIRAARGAGAGGVVIGAATADRQLDREALAVLAEAAGPLGRTLHRVFDLTPGPEESLELAIGLGFDRILTSGQQPTAALGRDLLARLVAQAAGRVTILAGGGIDAGTAGPLLARTGVTELHASCRAPEPPASTEARELAFGFGAAPRTTLAARVAALVAVARSCGTSQHRPH